MTPPTDTTDLLVAAATAAAAVLPAPVPLVAGLPVPGDDASATGYAGAVLAELQLPGAPRLAVLVGGDLVEALAGSPLGGLDLAAAAQPALDAAATALGTRSGPGRVVDVALVTHDLGGAFSLVPLIGGGTRSSALLVPTDVLRSSEAPTEQPVVALATPPGSATCRPRPGSPSCRACRPPPITAASRCCTASTWR